MNFQKYKGFFVAVSLILIVIIALGVTLRSCTKPLFGTVYRIARDVDIQAYQFLDKEKNILGFTDELLVAIAKDDGIEIQFFNAFATNLFQGLKLGYYDAIISNLRPTSILRESFVFSDPYFLLGPVLIVPASSNVTSLQQMENKVIGIEGGTSVVFDVETYPSIVIVPYDNVFSALDTLVAGKIDGVIMGALSAHVYIPNLYPGKLKIATEPLTKEGLRLIAKKGAEGEQFIEVFNKGLAQYKEDGQYEKLITHWGLYTPTQKLKE